MDIPERAYLAGLLDGEGCISIFLGGYPHCNIRTRRQTGGYNGMTLARVYIGICDEGVIRWCHRVTGYGSPRQRTRSFPQTHWKSPWTICWTGRKAAEILRDVLPYLQIKRRQAEIFIAWVELAEQTRHYKGPKNGAAYPEETIIQRDAWLDELRALNRRGQLLTANEATASVGGE